MIRALRTVVAIVAAAAPPLAAGQATWSPGHDAWWPYAPIGAVRADPFWPGAWIGPVRRGPYQQDLPSCYRIGRCSLNDVVRHLDRLDRLERLAPSTPQRSPAPVEDVRAVAPTDPKHVQPAYARTGQVRPQFERSGSVRD